MVLYGRMEMLKYYIYAIYIDQVGQRQYSTRALNINWPLMGLKIDFWVLMVVPCTRSISLTTKKEWIMIV